ncbi:MAG: nucleoside 2-deoxyribosyltransferase [Lachnospiraceae bacterium]|nr:nucleoside 2-deoxyribosyltransferase [Lachnospiraceae bacterium]
MIYIASPFFNDDEREALSYVESTLRKRGFEIFSPREHEVRDKEAGSQEWCRKVFELDRDAIDRCDTLVVIYHGNYSDSGTAWECGYAHGKGKRIVAVQLGNDANLMIHESVSANISLKELETYDFNEMPEKKYTGISF